ncbi:mitochondrial import inner membrane translocase subunit TIM50-like [Dendronephthya gigantea]|uniref:mitochondrial import inner membrane translocase subunit TIM50-like n=1 Tax=Dendronephthya gigantea TaxID=151771 RepID=UPI00106B3C61|nr:mitochondrial import inner membrane translocase subunit TIM50-like [Dendronephthya gigantea]
MAVNRLAIRVFKSEVIKSCCFRHTGRFFCIKPLGLSEHLRQFSVQGQGASKVNFLKRFSPRYMQYGRYYEKAKERKGPSLKTWLYVGAGLILGSAGAVIYLGWPDTGIDGKSPVAYSNEPFPKSYLYRARDIVKETWELFSEPSSEILLPEPLTEPYYQPPYTLVLEMTDVLIHPEYDRQSGWRFRKRPGVDAFLSQCKTPLFEIVVYTHENGFGAMPILEGLDPNGFITYRLFRDATKYTNGTHVKDLGSLNRDLSKVIMIDCDAKATVGYERNTIVLKKWTGDSSDRTLFDLTPLLLAIATSKVEDVRTVLDYYRSEDDVVEAFKRNQAKLREQQEILNQKQKEQGSQWGGLFGGRIFGGGKSSQNLKRET